MESSFPSTVHIGTEVGALIEQNKPIVCLYVVGKNPLFTSELHSSRLIEQEYGVENIRDVLRWALEEAIHMMLRRFTMLIPSDRDTYLGSVVKSQKVSRSEHIRGFIEREMKLSK